MRRVYDAIVDKGDKVDKRLVEMTHELTRTMDQTEGARNAANLLVNEMGQVVEGLAKWRVAAGQYINAQGEIVDKQGRSIRGLTVLQQKMKMYRDEQGRVRDANDKVVQGLGLLDQKLSDVDKALGLTYDAQGRLIKEVWDKEGKYSLRFYDELTESQKRRIFMRTSTGGFLIRTKSSQVNTQRRRQRG